MTELRFLTAGESHGPALLTLIEGIPSGLPMSEEIIDKELQRRQKGIGSGERMKIENDRCDLICGVMAGNTTGAPIGIQIMNQDHVHWQGKRIPVRNVPRPGHADLTSAIKYAYDDLRPGFERASARETVVRVAVGAVCKQFLSFFGIKIGGYVHSIGNVKADLQVIDYQNVLVLSESNDIRCPDQKAIAKMQQAIEKAALEGETLGGVIEVFAQGIPPGLGSHVHWDRKLDARLAQAVMSVPAIKGVEIGTAFENAIKTGSQIQDPIILKSDLITRETNAAGGLEGGITNGQLLFIRAAMKPIPTTRKPQRSVDLIDGKPHEMVYERSDVCPVPRAVVVVEAMIAFIFAQALLEKLGGDNLQEILVRYRDLPGLNLKDIKIDPSEKVWWQ